MYSTQATRLVALIRDENRNADYAGSIRVSPFLHFTSLRQAQYERQAQYKRQAQDTAVFISVHQWIFSISADPIQIMQISVPFLFCTIINGNSSCRKH